MTHDPLTSSTPGDTRHTSDADALLEHGHHALAWLAGYLAHPERYPVLSQVKPGDIAAQLPASPPARGEPLETILQDFERVIVPGITHWNHPAFFAYFAISSSVPGIIGELLAAGLDVNGMLWKTSPAATELEQVVLDWLRQMLGLEPGWFGIITDTASISTMLALAAAREARPGLDVRTRGLAGRSDLPRMRVYCSEHAHSSVDKAAITLGLGHENVVKIPADDAYRMRPDRLAEAIAADRALGYLPLACVATVGTTSTSSIDPVPAIAEICTREQVWLHVDGAYGGSAALVPEMRHVLAGVDSADSLVVNPHKWMFTPVDCSALYTKHPDILKRAFALVPEYLVTAEQGVAENLMDYGVQLGRRFRSLKLWMVLRAYGAEGMAGRIRAHCALAREFASWVEAEAGWQVVAPVPFSLVCFRYAPSGVDEAELERLNTRVMDRVNASGEAFLSHTKLDGRYVLRLAIGNVRTERTHVARAWELLIAAARSEAPAGA
ncbi:MAG TPA: pyridoxal-dependent decarboxylase [Gemmatimonadaceae bacterium]|nr:pyridoxal-dependent decarboxylase [Gemmatimonadaceae bacterium]